MPFDNVENEYIEKPKKWNLKSLKSFMFCFGFLSTLLDILCFGVLWYIMKFNTIEKADYFQCGWFMFGVISQTLIIHTIRTKKVPFLGEKTSKQLTISTGLITIITLIIGFSPIATTLDLGIMTKLYFPWIIILMLIYLFLAQIVKKIYIKINKEWI